jgi:hypothetical protein
MDVIFLLDLFRGLLVEYYSKPSIFEELTTNNSKT